MASGEEKDAFAAVVVEADEHALSDAAVDCESGVYDFGERGRGNLR